MFEMIKGLFGSEFPKDENGDVLRRMKASGMNFEMVYEVEFEHLFPDEKGARSMAKSAVEMGFKTEVKPFEEKGGWDCRVIVPMKLTHEGITSTEKSMGKMAEKYGGHSDGWGAMQE